MTDEEKAEEYATKISCDEETGEETLFISPTKKQAYLDGLAEGRKEKWHDLRKDPNDLPTKTGHYLTDDGDTCIYDTDCRKWRTLTCMDCWAFNWLDVGYIIAWCEIPKFKG